MNEKNVKIYYKDNKYYAVLLIGDIPIKMISEHNLQELIMTMDMYFGKYWGLE